MALKVKVHTAETEAAISQARVSAAHYYKVEADDIVAEVVSQNQHVTAVLTTVKDEE